MGQRVGGLPSDLSRGASGRTPRVPLGERAWDFPSFADVAIPRVEERLRALEELAGSRTLPVPPIPDDPFRPSKDVVLPPAENAVGGEVSVVRRGFVAKYRPDHPDRGTRFGSTDPCWDYPWGDPAVALNQIWVGDGHRGALRAVKEHLVRPGDLVWIQREKSQHDGAQHPWLNRRTLVGVTWVAEVADGSRPDGEVGLVLAPIRRFDFPVPVDVNREHDEGFRAVAAFGDKSRAGLIELTPDEAVAVAGACGLPARILSEPNPDALAPMVAGADLGPPTRVRRRILEGAFAQDHRNHVERAAVALVARQCRAAGWGVADTQNARGEHGAGADLGLHAVERDGTVRVERVEVKGTGTRDRWSVRLTRWERHHAELATKGGFGWWLVIVTNALAGPEVKWVTAEEALRIFRCSEDGGAAFSADRSIAKQLHP